MILPMALTDVAMSSTKGRGFAGDSDRDGIRSDQGFRSAKWMNEHFRRREGEAAKPFQRAALGVVADHSDMRGVANGQNADAVFSDGRRQFRRPSSQMAVPNPSFPSMFRTAPVDQVFSGLTLTFSSPF